MSFCLQLTNGHRVILNTKNYRAVQFDKLKKKNGTCFRLLMAEPVMQLHIKTLLFLQKINAKYQEM